MTMQIPAVAEPDARRPRAVDVEGMPVDFALAFEAFASYLGRRSPAVPAAAIAAVLADLRALFTEAVQDGITLRSVVGGDPADVAEALLANHADVPCNAGARADLTRAIDALTA